MKIPLTEDEAIHKYFLDENSKEIRLIKPRIESYLEKEHLKIKESKLKEKKRKYKYDLQNTFDNKLDIDEDLIFTIEILFDELSISSKMYFSLLDKLQNMNSKHLYNSLDQKDFIFLIKLIFILYKFSFSSENIKLFLLGKVTKDSIIKYIEILAVLKGYNEIRVKEYSLKFLEEKSKYINSIESIKMLKFIIFRNSKKEYLSPYDISEGFAQNDNPRVAKKFTSAEVYRIKNSRIYKKMEPVLARKNAGG